MAQTPAQFPRFPDLPAEIQCLVIKKHYEDPWVVSLVRQRDPLTSMFTCRYEFSPWMGRPLSVNHLFHAEAKRVVLKSKAGTYLHKCKGEEHHSAWFDDAITTLDVQVYNSFEPETAFRFKRRFKNLTRIVNVNGADLDVLERRKDAFLTRGMGLLIGDRFFHSSNGALGSDVTLSMEMAWPADEWAPTPAPAGLLHDLLQLLPQLSGQILFLQFEFTKTTCALNDLTLVDIEEETDWTAEEVVKMIKDAEEELSLSGEARTSD
ncbi:hypothetical protein LTS08_000944 [Lithohypha guttulata]|uniref:uncharacterized protein n=1 Tax=Lithohypha guttulata TaxID=1690604 RepID=UPI002DDF680B|nr:hypothetical protein LTS08_000944 [Lithohypha guttulata]